MNDLNWPDSAAYRHALDDASSLGESVTRGRLVRTSDGEPESFAGTFSTTFRLRAEHADVALKCFTRGGADLERRYAEIARFLRYIFNGALCRTQFVPHGIRVEDAWRPVVEMEWVEGRTLRDEVLARLDDRDALARLADDFRDVVRSLNVLGIAHGDLQHANVLVSDGRLRLIDYDGMFVPTLVGESQSEFGHPNYQHPDRRFAPFDARLDRFPSMVIYTALTALAADPTLWARFDVGDNLLFRAYDFRSDGSSELFRSLLQNNATSSLAQELVRVCRMPVEQAPTLDGVIESAAGTMAPHVQQFVAKRAPVTAPPVSEVAAGSGAVAASAAEPEILAQVLTPWPDEPVPARSSGGVPRGVAALAVLFIVASLAAFAWRVGPTILAKYRKPQLHPAVATISKHAASRHHVARSVAMAAATLAPAPQTAAPTTAEPTLTPTARPRKAPTHLPTIAPHPVAKKVRGAKTVAIAARHRGSPSAARGAWQIVEGNIYDGSMVWRGNAAVSNGGAMVLDVHKERIAGRAASRCERNTSLHVAIPSGDSAQMVPFTEVNCAGATSGGEIRVSSFSPGSRTMHGSFWQRGTYLGNFSARKL